MQSAPLSKLRSGPRAAAATRGVFAGAAAGLGGYTVHGQGPWDAGPSAAPHVSVGVLPHPGARVRGALLGPGLRVTSTDGSAATPIDVAQLLVLGAPEDAPDSPSLHLMGAAASRATSMPMHGAGHTAAGVSTGSGGAASARDAAGHNAAGGGGTAGA